MEDSVVAAHSTAAAETGPRAQFLPHFKMQICARREQARTNSQLFLGKRKRAAGFQCCRCTSGAWVKAPGTS